MGDGLPPDMKAISSVTEDSLLQIATDLDLFVALGINPKERKYPSRHSLQSATLAMAVGTVHGLTQPEIVELGIGCLVHDVGMIELQNNFFKDKSTFSANDKLLIAKHPTYTFDLLQKVHNIPKASIMVAYQIHERCNGMGYPRGRHGNQIHHLAKIGMLADVYIALISDRPHRSGMLPYKAIEQILHQTRQGQFDPHSVRSLLQTLSLFPIGSFVKLNDGNPAKVMRTNRENYSMPVVEVWEMQSDNYDPHLVNLGEEKSLKIIEPLRDFPLMTPEFSV